MKRQFLGTFIAFATALIPLLPTYGQSAQVTEEPTNGWSEPILLFEGEGWTQYNALVASDDGVVHAFWQSDPSFLNENMLGKPGADNLWYSQIQDKNVSEPVNILVPPPDGGFMRSIRAVMDQNSALHLFLYSEPHCLQHSVARLSYVLLPQEWMDHTSCVADTNLRFGVTQDINMQIHLAYATREGRVLYNRYSPTTSWWSIPTTVFDGLEGINPADTRITVDTNGRIHVVWSEYQAPDYYPPIGIFYSQSSDGGRTWRTPRRLAGEGHVEPEILSIEDNQIHVIWNGSAVINNRYHRYSKDGGKTWSAQHTFEIEGGILGPPAVAVDSSNRLHAFLSSGHGLFYTYWTENQGWFDLQQIWSDVTTGDPSAIITGGNRLHIIFRERTRKIWYMWREVDAPAVTPEPRISSTANEPRTTPSIITSSMQASTPQTNDKLSQGALNSEIDDTANHSPGFPLLVGIMPIVFMIMALIGATLRRRR